MNKIIRKYAPVLIGFGILSIVVSACAMPTSCGQTKSGSKKAHKQRGH